MVLRTKANRCLTSSELALKIKESDGCEIRKSDTIVRALWVSVSRTTVTVERSVCMLTKNNINNQAVTENWFLEIFYIVVDRTIVHAPLIVFHTSFSNTNFQSSFYGLGAKTEMLYFEKIA